ncbi:MAG: hypothetical protein Q9216_003237 [Gyalolechia sp. 2 TL-2023]
MDYHLSLKFWNRGPDLGRNSDERLRPSPRSILPNDDPLPSSFAALEGHLNHHASQLQQLADRVESINEWIELDNIVLARLIRDEEKKIEDLIAAERNSPGATTPDGKKGVHFATAPVPPVASGTAPLVPPSEKMGKRSASMGDVPRSPSLGNPKTDTERKEEAVEAHWGIREAKERIRGMKRWRKEVEKAVFWQREEYWRVESRMGREKRKDNRESVAVSGDGNADEDVGGNKEASTGGEEKKMEEGLSVVGGGKWEEGKREKWSKESAGGRLPTQREWEALFSYA